MKSSMDKLEEIKARFPDIDHDSMSLREKDIAWLIGEVKRLRALQKEDEEIRNAVDNALAAHGIHKPGTLAHEIAEANALRPVRRSWEK